MQVKNGMRGKGLKNRLLLVGGRSTRCGLAPKQTPKQRSQTSNKPHNIEEGRRGGREKR